MLPFGGWWLVELLGRKYRVVLCAGVGLNQGLVVAELLGCKCRAVLCADVGLNDGFLAADRVQCI